MTTIYVDRDYRCRTADGEGLSPVETDVFSGKCQAYVQGFRHVPEGCSWTRADGQVFHGPMTAPAQDYRPLYAAQRRFEEEQRQQFAAACEAAGEMLSDEQAARVPGLFRAFAGHTAAGQRRMYEGRLYRCVQDTSHSPADAPGLWKEVGRRD